MISIDLALKYTPIPISVQRKEVADAEVPDQAAHDSQLLFNEPDYLKIGDNRDAALINEDGLPSRAKDTFKQGVYY